MWANRKTEQEIRRDVARKVAELSRLTNSQTSEGNLMHSVIAVRNEEVDALRHALSMAKADADDCWLASERLRGWAAVGKIGVVVGVGAVGAAVILMAR
jgi:hypothetical protein